MQTWIAEELGTSDLGDERLNRRFEVLLDRLSARPNLSIPTACEGWTETQAAYRFFDNAHVSPEKLLAPHREATYKRVAAQPVVLTAQDTTEIELTRKQEKVGGPLNDEKRWGIHVHPLAVFTPERVPLGVLQADIWARDPDDFHKRSQRRNKAIEDKESYRWLEGYRQACELARQCPDTQVICLSDSEGDIYECYVEAAPQEGARKADFIVRACQDRCLIHPIGEKMYSAVEQSPVLKRLTIAVSQREAQSGDGSRRRQARQSRMAVVTVQATSVTLQSPRRKGTKLPEVTLNVVLVREENPPEGEEPIEWLLCTNLPIDTLEQVLQVLDYYCCRWEIEIYFRILKSGCRVEHLQLETTERLSSCVALYMIVAWRVHFVTMMGRTCPDLCCEAVLSSDEWRAVYRIVKRQPPPSKPPTLGEMIPLIAGLGGYLNRKHDHPPGPKAMWIGIQRTRDFALAWNAFGPEKQSPTYV